METWISIRTGSPTHLYVCAELKCCSSKFFICLWLYSPVVGPWPLFQFLNLYTVGRTPWTGDQPVARPLPTRRTTQIQKKRKQTYMYWVGFEPTIPVYERAKIAHTLDRTATVISSKILMPTRIYQWVTTFFKTSMKDASKFWRSFVLNANVHQSSRFIKLLNRLHGVSHRRR
jgi:hypothetical protein